MPEMNSPNALSKIGQSVGAEPDKVQQVAQLGMPAILQALGRNASTSEGATALTGALDQHQNDTVHGDMHSQVIAFLGGMCIGLYSIVP